MSASFIDLDIQPEPTTGEHGRSDNGNGDVPPAFKSAEAPPKPPPPQSLQARIEGMYVTLAIAAMPFDPVWAQEIVTNAPVCAEAWMALARENATVKRMLERLLTVSATGAVIAAHLPIIITAPGVRERLAGTMFSAMMREQQATP